MADRERESGKGQDQTAESATGAGAAPGTMMGALVDRLGAAGARRVIQRRLAERREKAEPDSAEVQAAAESGVRGPAGSLPHQATIQKAFGKHDVSHVKAHVGGEAAKGAAAMGAEAFATGDHVGFAGAPSLHTAAHEAAHVIQQQAGVHLSGGVGQEGDRHEQHADAVAQRVVEERSAEGLLDQATGEEEEEWDEDEEEEGGAPPTASATTATTQAATTATVGHPGAAPASPPGKATQAKRRSAPAPTGVVQLARQPAVVTFGKGAGLHKSDRKKKLPNAPVKVRSGGILGSGTKVKIPAGTQIVVDPQKPVTNAQYLYAEHGGKIGYVKSAKVAGEQIGASSYWALPDVTGAWQIWNDQSHQIVGQETFAAGQKNAVMQSLAHVMGTQTVVEDKDGLIKEVVHKCRMGNAPDPALWQQAAINIDQKIATRVQADAAQLVAAGLITNQHHLRGVKFTGADFHKGGQAPFFLTFETNDAQNPDVRKVVYKPGNLGVDKQLFGSQQGSLARALDDQGTAISNYTILTRQDAAHHNEHYGYMKFVESGAPTNQAELLSVYQSLAANMAVSFLAGLEDIHHENVLLLRDRVQVIDMEATTGMFSKKQNQQGALDPGRGGFLAMQWNGALRGIKDKLLEAANSGALQSAPASGAAQAAMVTKFGQILGAAQQGGFDQSW
ncbi:MAG: DUF4135 domain-containing protein, partial [Polyangia bacterium]